MKRKKGKDRRGTDCLPILATLSYLNYGRALSPKKRADKATIAKTPHVKGQWKGALLLASFALYNFLSLVYDGGEKKKKKGKGRI